MRASTDYLACADGAGTVILYDLGDLNNSAAVSVPGEGAPRGALALEMSEDLLLAHRRDGRPRERDHESDFGPRVEQLVRLCFTIPYHT